MTTRWPLASILVIAGAVALPSPVALGLSRTMVSTAEPLLVSRWSVAVFVYAKGQDAGDDLTRIATAGQRCPKRVVLSRDGVTWSVRHVGAATIAGGPWAGFRTRDAESTMMKQNPLRVTTTFWSRGNVLVEIQQVVPAGRSLRQAGSWLSAADSRVLGVLSLDRGSSTPGAV